MKKVLLLLLLVAGGVSTMSAWDNVYLQDDDNKWGDGNQSGYYSHPFSKTDDDNFYIDLNANELLKLRTDDYHFRFYVSNDASDWAPKTDNDVISATDYATCEKKNTGSFKIAQNTRAKSVRINLSYNNNDGDWKWHVTATITSYSNNTSLTYVNASGKTAISTDVYAYVWDNTNSGVPVLGGFPGTKMTANADGTFSLSGVDYDSSSEMKVIFSNGSDANKTGTLDFGDNKVYVRDGFVGNQTITLNSYGMTTYCSQYPLDFSTATVTEGEGSLAAYRITENSPATGVLEKSSVNKVPAGTGIYLEGTPNKSFTVNTTVSASSVGTNMLVGVTSETDVEQTEDEGATTNYILTVETINGTVDTPKFFKVNDGGNTVPAGKAYLQIPTEDAAREFFWFDGETTAVKAVKQEQKFDGKVFNLAGQRIANPTKGLYIVNGKKVIK